MELDFDRLFAPARGPSSGFPRLPTILEQAMVATSHPLATRAGVRALEAGGNAIDAALAAAATLTVAEPTDNGPGGDAFALVWHGGELHGINGSGRAPAELGELTVEEHGPRSVTVPGAVMLWADLAERFGSLGLDRCLELAIDLAERGLAATARIADRWRRTEQERGTPWPAPRAGERYRLPELGRTLRRIAEQGPRAFYEGPVARAIAAASWLSEADLAAHRSQWVEPLRLPLGEAEVCELPPNGQGAAALIALGIAEGLCAEGPVGRLHNQIEAMKLAFADARRYIADEPLPDWLLDPDQLAERRALVRLGRALDAEPSPVPASNTTYLCCVDGDRNAVSLIQSVFHTFGSGVLAGDTGVVLHNRAAGFSLDRGHPNRIAPGKRPYHTIIPGFLLERGALLGPFGIMGGPMQPQAHLQVVSELLGLGADPQGALDAPRFRVLEGRRVALEPGLWQHADALRALGHEPVLDRVPHEFGVGQMILQVGSALVGGSDGRADGHAGGF